MNNNSIVSDKQLKDITKYKNTGDVQKCLSRQGIQYYYGKNNTIWTTIGLIEAAKGVSNNGADLNNFKPEDIL